MSNDTHPVAPSVVERLAALEATTALQGKIVTEKLEQGARGFEHVCESIEKLTKKVEETHRHCASPADLDAHHKRIGRLEKLRDRLAACTAWTGAVGVALVAFIAWFGPGRIAAAWSTLWSG